MFLKLQHLIFNSKYDKKLFLDPFYYNIPVHGKYINDISFSDNNEVFIIYIIKHGGDIYHRIYKQ